MKKVLMFLVLAVSLVACEGPMGPQGEIGPPGYDGKDGMNGKDGMDGKDGKDGQGANWYSRTFVIQPHEWQRNGEPNELEYYFMVVKDFPQLTQEIYREKAVIAYIQTNDNVKNGMPYVLHQGEFDNDGNKILWTETCDFDYSPGEVAFYLTVSDFLAEYKPDKALTFHVVLIW